MILSILCAFVFISAKPCAGTYYWDIDTLDYEVGTGYYSSIAVDANNIDHICYYDKTNGDLKYATNADGSWHLYRIDTTGDVGLWVSSAVDRYGIVHASYYNASAGDLKYARISGTYWTTETVDSNGDVGLYTSIAVDAARTVHISYVSADNGFLKYATNENGYWTISDVDASSSEAPSIALDSQGRVHIAYTNSGLKYATNLSRTWEITTIDNGEYAGDFPSIAVDPSDHIHICYNDLTDHCVKYATNSHGDWTTQVIDRYFYGWGRTDIVVDDNYVAHVCTNAVFLPSGSTSDLRYATNEGGSWTTYVVDQSSDVGEFSSIDIGFFNRIHMSYFDRTDGHLKYAREIPPPAPSIVLVTPAAGAVWTAGYAYEIAWTTTETSGPYVNIEYDYAGHATPTQIAASTENDGSYSWTIPADTVSRNDYFVRVVSTTQTSVYDVSEFFSIEGVEPPSISITSPTSTSVWACGSTHNITWTTTGNTGANVKVEYDQFYASNPTVITYSAINDGIYSWTIPVNIAARDDYIIRVTSVDQSAIGDDSDLFEIVVAPRYDELHVTLRNDGTEHDWIKTTNPQDWKTGTFWDSGDAYNKQETNGSIYTILEYDLNDIDLFKKGSPTSLSSTDFTTERIWNYSDFFSGNVDVYVLTLPSESVHVRSIPTPHSANGLELTWYNISGQATEFKSGQYDKLVASSSGFLGPYTSLVLGLLALLVIILIVLLIAARRRRGKGDAETQGIPTSKEAPEPESGSVNEDASRAQAKFCRQCGHAIVEDAAYCEGCGRKL